MCAFVTHNIFRSHRLIAPTSIDSFSLCVFIFFSFLYDRASPFETVERGSLRRCSRINLVPTFLLRGRRRVVLAGTRVMSTSQLVTCQCREPFGRRDGSRAQEEVLLLLYTIMESLMVMESSEFNVNSRLLVFASLFLGGTVRLISVLQFPQIGFHQRLTVIRQMV